MSNKPMQWGSITNDDLERVKAFVMKSRNLSDDRADELFNDLSDWQPELFAWLKNEAEYAQDAGDVINAQLIALIALFEKYGNQGEHITNE
jgi:hypothetical protein